MDKKLVTWVDPPEGWRWGFPKPMPDDVENFREWLVAEGYPQAEIDALGDFFHVRCWKAEAE